MVIAGARRLAFRELLRGLGDVTREIPRFVSAPLYRRRPLTWGATRDEVADYFEGWLPS